jgi:hypothetical protein
MAAPFRIGFFLFSGSAANVRGVASLEWEKIGAARQSHRRTSSGTAAIKQAFRVDTKG